MLAAMRNVRELRSCTGLIIGLYVTMHLSNHALGLISVHAQEAARPWVMALWHSLPGQVLLYGSLATHAALGLAALARRRHGRLPLWETTQLWLGLAVPYLLLVHIVNTRGTRLLTHIDIDYVYEIANLWVDPVNRWRQVLLVLLVWGHFTVGLHYWWRLYGWYRRVFPALLLAYVLLPAGALLGFAEAGVRIGEHARVDPAWYLELKTRGIPADPRHATWRAELKRWVGPGWLGLVGTVFAGAQLRNWLLRKQRYKVTYPEGFIVEAPMGMSILEVSRLAERPHISVCGGRARCTTCRVHVDHAEGELPPPADLEARALCRIGAPSSVRLACQLRPRVDVTVQPLLNLSLTETDLDSAREPEQFGDERQVTILFIDVRGSTQLAEKRLPYDVVFLLNQFFAEMGDAVRSEGGHYSNFTGDGLMALFGLGGEPDKGARAALTCALRMLERLERLNQRLCHEMETPLRIGVGIHTGEAIVGRMGPPTTPILSALGDSVNTAARLESMTKELHCGVVVSFDTLQAAELSFATPLFFVMLRGRSTRLAVSALDADALRLLLA